MENTELQQMKHLLENHGYPARGQMLALIAQYEAEHTARLAAEQRVRELEEAIKRVGYNVKYIPTEAGKQAGKGERDE